MYENFFKYIRVDPEFTSKDGSKRICAEIPYNVFDVMPMDMVIEFFQMEPEFHEVYDYEDKRVLCVTYQSKNEKYLIYRRKRLVEFDNMIDERKREQK